MTNGLPGYTCLCPPNYGGVNCTLLNPCASLPCANNGSVLSICICCQFSSMFSSSASGTCVYVNGTTFQCNCPPGLTGPTCATIVNPCNSNPCRNNGQCLSLGTQFICICLPGFNGTLCDVLVNPCGSNPCNQFIFSSYH